MKLKKLYIKIILLFFLSGIVTSNYCFADDTLKIQEEDNTLSNQENKEQLLGQIYECINELKDELNEIDKKLNTLDKTQEYEKYPAIRLNIDTPFFGLSSMVNTKLKIKNDVSTVDVAKGYGIKDIVNMMSIKLPNFVIGNIVVSTKDVKLGKDISEDDARLCILKLVQYISQVKSVNELLDKRISDIFEGYISEERQNNIHEINKKIEDISKSVTSKDDDVILIKLLESKENSQFYFDEYLRINSKIYGIKDRLKNLLLSDYELENINKEVVTLELDVFNYIDNVSAKKEEITKSINEKDLLLNIKQELLKKQENLEKYVNDSTKIISKENGETEEKKNYPITSKYLVENNISILNSLEEKIVSYIHDDVTVEENVSQENKNEISDEERKILLQEVIKLYNEYISKENKFYLDNLNYILRDTTYKLTKLPRYTDTETVKDIKYIYISLPEEIDNFLNMYNTKSNIILEVLSFEYKDRLNKIVDSNIKINTEYDKYNQS